MKKTFYRLGRCCFISLVLINLLNPAWAKGASSQATQQSQEQTQADNTIDASKLSIEELQKMSPEELGKLRNFTAEQLLALTPEQLAAIDPEEFASLTPEQLAAIEPAVGPVAGLLGSNALFGIGGAAAIGGGVAAAAGGGGGGGDTSPASDTTPPAEESPAPPPAPAPSIAEEDRQVGWKYVGADYAQAQGITGRGVNISILDTLIDTDSIELLNTKLDCYNAATDSVGCEASPTSPQNGHGTFVSGILAADDNNIYMVGIAPEANLLNGGIFHEEDTGFDIRLIGVGPDERAKALNWAVANGAQVSNHSYGFSGAYNGTDRDARVAVYADGTDIHAAIDNAVANDVVLVWAAGNDGLDQPSTQAALPLDFPEWKDHWLVVTAVDTVDGGITGYANKCGDTAAFCLAAPGGDPSGDGGLYSYTTQNFIAIASGTSFATPHVTGAVALAIEKFGPGTASNLSNDRIADLILGTANKSGLYADQETYGQGLLDIEAALRYDPSTGVFATGSTFQTGTQPVTSTNISFGPAFGNGAISALSGIQAGASDRFGRIAFVDLGSLTGGASAALNGKKLLTNFAQTSFSTQKIGDFAELRIAFTGDSLDDALNTTEDSHSELKSLSFTSEWGNASTLQLDYKRNPALQMGLQAQDNLSDSLLMTANEKSLTPYFDFAGENGMSAGLQMDMSGQSSVKVLGFITAQEKIDVLLDKGAPEQDRASGFAVESAYDISDDLRLGLMGGVMREENYVLGTEGAGAFGLKNNTPTIFTGLNVRYQLGDNSRFIASAQKGWTNADAMSDSFYQDFSTIQTDSYTAGFVMDNQFRDRDRVGFLIHQPLRVASATADISYPVARANDGSVISRQEKINLEPDGREINFQAFYQTTFDHDQQFNMGFMLRHEPGHIADAKPDGVAIIRYSIHF